MNFHQVEQNFEKKIVKIYEVSDESILFLNKNYQSKLRLKIFVKAMRSYNIKFHFIIIIIIILKPQSIKTIISNYGFKFKVKIIIINCDFLH